MNLQEFYDNVGANYDDVKSRLPEGLLIKLLKMFPEDTSFHDLQSGIEEKDAEKAFRGVHTLKGVCLNLGLESLSKLAIALTEDLRDRKLENYEDNYEALCKEYQIIIESIKQL